MRRCAEVVCRRLRRGARTGWLALAWLGLAAAGAQANGSASNLPRLDQRAAIDASQAVVGSTPVDFTLLDRREKPVRLSSYRGKPLLVSFIYTGCFTICPTQTRTLHESVQGLQRMLGPHQFNVVSIGFNQPFDAPQAMRAFAAQNGVDDPNWEFLSPHRNQVDALTRAYGFSYVETPAGFDHVLGVTVVDAHGRIHAQVYGSRMTAEALGQPLRELLLAAPPAADAKLPTFESLVDRVRILCTVYDPDTGEYRYDWKLILELIGGALFFSSAFGYMAYVWRSERRLRGAARQRAATTQGA